MKKGVETLNSGKVFSDDFMNQSRGGLTVPQTRSTTVDLEGNQLPCQSNVLDLKDSLPFYFNVLSVSTVLTVGLLTSSLLL